MGRRKLTDEEKEQRKLERQRKKKEAEKQELEDISKSFDTIKEFRIKGEVDWIRRVSIDKMSIVGNPVDFGTLDFQLSPLGKIGSKSTTLAPTNGAKKAGSLFGKIYWSLTEYHERFKRRLFRMEFNPNNLTQEEVDFIKNEVMPYLMDAGITRLDIAFDCDVDLMKYHLEDKAGKKLTVIYGRDKAKETQYLGSRGSEEMFRIYNKFRELKLKTIQSLRAKFGIDKKRKKQLKTKTEWKYRRIHGKAPEKEEFEEIWLEYFKNYVMRVRRFRDHLAEKIVREQAKSEGLMENWWRVELQWRRDKKMQMLEPTKNEKNEKTKNPFDNIRMYIFGYEKLDWEIAAAVEYLTKEPERWSQLSKNTAKKYKKIIEEHCIQEDITDAFNSAFEQKKPDLWEQVTDYMRKAHDYDENLEKFNESVDYDVKSKLVQSIFLDDDDVKSEKQSEFEELREIYDADDLWIEDDEI